MSSPQQPRTRFYLSLKVGIEAPFNARILEIGNGIKLETHLASLADVRGLLKDVRPIAWVDETRLDVGSGALLVVPGKPEPLGVLIERAIHDLDVRESSAGHAGLVLADGDLETLRVHFETWRRKPVPPD